MKFRRHTNNKGYRTIKTGGCERQIREIAQKLKIKYKEDDLETLTATKK